MKVRLSAEAERDIESIADYIARDDPVRALSFVRELRTKCLGLADMPRAFPLVRRYEKLGIRRRLYGNYLIFYRLETDCITVLHVLNGAQDYTGIIFDDGRDV